MLSRHLKGTIAVAIFLSVSTVISVLAAITLLIPGSALDKIWAGKQGQYQQLLQHGVIYGCLFLALAMLLFFASYGWLHLYRWGWLLTTAVIGLNVLSDVARAASGSYVEGMVGLVIGGLFLYYLLRPSVKKRFRVPSAT